MNRANSLVEFLATATAPQSLCTVPVDLLAATLVANLVRDPAEVTVQCRGDDTLRGLTFDVGAENKGRVIGRNGHIIKAVRSICRAVARSRGCDVIIDIAGWAGEG